MDASNLKGFARLTHLYPQRQAMQATLEVQRELAIKRQTNVLVRTMRYVRAKPFRFIFAGIMIYFANRYTWLQKTIDWRTRMYASYRARWMRFYNNPAYRYDTVDQFSISRVAASWHISEN